MGISKNMLSIPTSTIPELGGYVSQLFVDFEGVILFVLGFLAFFWIAGWLINMLSGRKATAGYDNEDDYLE